MFHLPSALRKKKKTIQTYLGKNWQQKFFLRVGLMLLMLGLISYSVYQLVQHITVGLDTLRTQELEEVSYASLDFYTFRDEHLLVYEGDVFAYEVADGQRVGVGKTLATAYVCPEGTDPSTLQAQIKDLSRRVALLQYTIGQADPTDVDGLKDAVDLSYLAFLEAVAEGDAEAANTHAQQMKSYLNAYDALVSGDSGVAETVESLTATQAALVATCTPAGQIVTSQSGYFYYDIDGFESHFTADTALQMTPAEFLTLSTAKATPQTQGVVGKLVYTPTWYAAAYVSLADVPPFQNGVGKTYAMTLTNGSDVTIPLTLVRMEPDANGALLVFKTQAMPDGFDFSRSFSAMVQTGSQSGYRVPTDALVTLQTDNGEMTGVYVLEGNVVEFRRVMVEMNYGGYVLAKTYPDVQTLLEGMDDAQRQSLTAGGYSYLNLNDRIITRGTGLYHGKIIS